MLSLEPEIEALRAQGLLPPAVAERLLVIERRDPMSVHAELRIVFWAAVTMIATGLGIFLKKNIDQIGHLTLILIIAAVSAGCYVITWRRKKAGKASAADDYLLLLGALLLSADVGYVETQYHFLGKDWRQYLLILVGVHGATAYLYDSRAVLGLSLASLAGWLGIDSSQQAFSLSSWEAGRKLLTMAALSAVWRVINHLNERWRHFDDVFDHVIAHTAMIGALVWTFDDRYELLGLAVLAGLAAVSIAWGIRTRREAFIVYGFVYAVIGVDSFLVTTMDEAPGLIFLLVTTPLEIAALFMIHRRWKTD